MHEEMEEMEDPCEECVDFDYKMCKHCSVAHPELARKIGFYKAPAFSAVEGRIFNCVGCVNNLPSTSNCDHFINARVAEGLPHCDVKLVYVYKG